jgi:hypothetical protein
MPEGNRHLMLAMSLLRVAGPARRVGRKLLMIDVLRIGLGKPELLKMTPEERGMFLLLGHLSNQVNVLWKTVIVAQQAAKEEREEADWSVCRASC